MMFEEITQEDIRPIREDIKWAINKLYDDLHILQSKCTHPDVTKEYKANTGNYDPSCDRYWINFHCPDCDKRWREDQ